MAKGNLNKSGSKIDTILAEDIVFRGLLKFKDSLQIEGNFEGKIETTGHLIIARKSTVRADIEAQTVSISGKLEGNIQNAEMVELFSKSEINGDIHTKDFYVESGSKFNGVCIMQK